MSSTNSVPTRLIGVGLVVVVALLFLVAPAAQAARVTSANSPGLGGGPTDGVAMCIITGLAPSPGRYVDKMPFQPACLPDLVVEALTVTQTADTAAAAYETVLVNFTIKNQGGLPAGPIVAQVVFGATKRNLGAFTLKPGESYSGSASAIGPHGTIQMVSILIDPSNVVVESNKANNAKTIEVAVR